MKILAAIFLLSPTNPEQFQIKWAIGGLFFSPIEVLCMYQRNRIIDWMANICEKCFEICHNFTVPYTQRDVWWNQTGKALCSSAPEAGSMARNLFALYCTYCSNIPESSNEIYYVYDYTENGLDGLEGWSL